MPKCRKEGMSPEMTAEWCQQYSLRWPEAQQASWRERLMDVLL
jgi:hypothetical protein